MAMSTLRIRKQERLKAARRRDEYNHVRDHVGRLIAGQRARIRGTSIGETFEAVAVGLVLGVTVLIGALAFGWAP